MLFVEKGTCGGGGISSAGTEFFKALPDVDFTDMIVSLVFDRTEGVLPDLSEDGAGPIGGRVEVAKGPSRALDRESGRRGTIKRG